MHNPVLAIVTPLFGCFLAVVSAWTGGLPAMVIALTALSLSVSFSVGLLVWVLTKGPVTYLLGGWAPPWGIVLSVDTFSAVMLCLVSASALVNLISYRTDITRNMSEKSAAFLGLYQLATAGHMGIVATGDIFNLYVFVEVAALSGYSLLSFQGPRAAMASLKYLMIGSVGASFYLLGVGFLYVQSGSLNMLDIAGILAKNPASVTLAAGLVIIVVGLWTKMALFPFHGWLPGAYGQSALPAASLIAPMTTKVMAYVIVRLVLFVFPAATLAANVLFTDAAVWLASAAILVGAALALTQTDLRRMLCCILVAEIGYMAGGVFLGNAAGMTGTMLHILADAAMTLTLFMALGNLAERRGDLSMEKLDGLFAGMPVTMAAFVLGALSMIGVPPLCGFYSKWYLVSGAIQAGQYQFATVLIISSLINVVLFFRFFERAYFGKAPTKGYDDVSWMRLAPLGLAALALPLIGLLTGSIVTYVIAPVLAAAA